jgi:hypothetical protein
VFDDHHKTYVLTSLPSWSFLRCIKFIYIYKEYGPLVVSINMGRIKTCTSLRCTGQCLVPRLAYPTNRLLSRKLSALRLKFTGLSGVHRTIQWAHEPTVIFTNGRLPPSKIVRSQKQSTMVRSHRTIWCATGAGRFNGRLPQTPTVGWRGRHWTMNNGMSGAHQTVWCARRQKATANDYNVVGAYKYPQPPPFKVSKPSTLIHSIQEQRINSKSHSKLPISSSATIKTSDH